MSLKKSIDCARKERLTRGPTWLTTPKPSENVENGQIGVNNRVKWDVDHGQEY